MTLMELLECLADPCHAPDGADVMQMKVVFDTANRGGLELFSCYVHEGVIHVDVGDDDDE